MSDEMKLKFMEMFSKGNTTIGQFIVEINGDNHYHEAASKDNNVKDVTTEEQVSKETLTKAVMAVQPYFWGNSSYAVLFCVCRDCYDFPDNMSQFERVIVSLPFTRELSYMCNEGTISNALNASPYMKLHIDKWATNGAKERVLALRDKFINAIDSAREEK